VAIGSKRGDIRLFNKVGIKAKTLIPGLGDPIIGMDTTENGKVILSNTVHPSHLFPISYGH
jgi:hypothetical protein